MAFMEAPKSGDFIPYIKYDGKAGRWFSRPNDKDAELFEVKDMTAVFDIANVKTGWFEYPTGAAPIVTLDPSMTEAAPKPADKAKRGFQVLLFSDKNIGGLREMSSTAGVTITAFNEVHTEWESAPEAKAGKLPVITCTGVTPVRAGQSTNYQPTLKIVSWVDRPAAFDGPSAAEEKPAPSAKATPPAAAADDDAPQF